MGSPTSSHVYLNMAGVVFFDDGAKRLHFCTALYLTYRTQHSHRYATCLSLRSGGVLSKFVCRSNASSRSWRPWMR